MAKRKYTKKNVLNQNKTVQKLEEEIVEQPKEEIKEEIVEQPKEEIKEEIVEQPELEPKEEIKEKKTIAELTFDELRLYQRTGYLPFK